MKLLFIGDISSKPGIEHVADNISSIKKEHKIDIVIANGENIADGMGIYKQGIETLFKYVDVITTGNHCFDKLDSLPLYDECEYLLRPVNFPKGAAGKGFCEVDFGAFKIAVINIMGTVFMKPLDNLYESVDKILPQLTTRNIFVDIHAEATGEKKALAYYLAGKVTAVIGTHTHIQTNDETIMNGTGYITDVGMTGVIDSILGVEPIDIINSTRYHTPVKFRPAQGKTELDAVIIEFDKKTGICTSINKLKHFVK
ncbi:MAG: YmdB family metallophosphoesterase [Ruminococcus sp.]|jgi:metallophosphoesterase (TIGR00282 family)|nr:YmdB family metallophosphoesterase [Ruminococcus sp.]